MNRTRLHLLGVLVSIVSFATSAPSLPRHHMHSSSVRGASQVQLDDDEERDTDAAVIEEELPDEEAGSDGWRRRA